MFLCLSRAWTPRSKFYAIDQPVAVCLWDGKKHLEPPHGTLTGPEGRPAVRAGGWGVREPGGSPRDPTWEASGSPFRSQRTVGRGLPAAAQPQRRLEPMSASMSEMTLSHSGWAAGSKRERLGLSERA